jgi:radical SAM superfamily enzyme YgiQ (UPF0313 family)
MGGAHAVVRGDGEVIWKTVLADCLTATPKRVYEAGRIEADELLPARWSLVPRHRYMWASVQTVRGCPKHCSFCSVWRTDGQHPRQRGVQTVIDEIVTCGDGDRFVVVADDNFIPSHSPTCKWPRAADRSRPDELTAQKTVCATAGSYSCPTTWSFYADHDGGG